MHTKILLLTGVALAWGIAVQAQQFSEDTTLRDYHIRYYHLQGLPDDLSSKRTSDSIGLRPPVRDQYQDLQQFKKDSIDFLQFKHVMDSLDHRIDSLRALIIPAVLCWVRQAPFQLCTHCPSKEAIFSLHSFSAMACSLRTRLIRTPSSPVVIS